MMKGYLDTDNTTTTTVSVTGLPSNAAGYQVYVYADGDNGSDSHTGSYTISGTGITTTTISLIDAPNTNFSGTFTQGNNSAGNYVVFTIPNVSGFTLSATPSASTSSYLRAPVNGMQIVPLGGPSPGFTLSAAPSSQSVNAGSSTSYTVSTSAVAGFTGSISFTASGLPAGASASFNPTSVTVGASTTMTITTTSSTPAGSSTVTITGTGGSVQHTAGVTLNVAATGGSSGKVISIDFVGQDVAMAATEVAGVVAKANWNGASGVGSSAPLALVDETGSATTAVVSWSSNNLWETPITDQAGNARMMKGYLDTDNTTTTTVSVTGLPSNAAGYQVYVYADGDNGSDSHTGSYTISGTGITTTKISLIDAPNSNFSGTFTQGNNSAGNYVVFTIPNVSGFTLSATPSASTSSYLRAPVNGMQIVPQ
jgi:hypothetical protein